MGGLIALMLASRRHVDGLVVVSAPLRIRDPRAPFLPLIALVRKYEPPAPPASPAEMGVEERRTVSYSQKPVACIQSLIRLMQAVKAETPHIEAPLLAAYGAHDRTAPPEDGQWIIDHAGRGAGTDAGRDAASGALRRLVVLESSDHFGMLGPDRDTLFGEIEAFIVG
jgi:esterase/lipase